MNRNGGAAAKFKADTRVLGQFNDGGDQSKMMSQGNPALGIGEQSRLQTGLVQHLFRGDASFLGEIQVDLRVGDGHVEMMEFLKRHSRYDCVALNDKIIAPLT